MMPVEVEFAIDIPAPATPDIAKQTINSHDDRSVIKRVEELPRIPTVVYNTDWNDDMVRTIPPFVQPKTEIATDHYSPVLPREHVRIQNPQSILAHEQYEQLKPNNNEQTTNLDMTMPTIDHTNERIQTPADLTVAIAILQNELLDSDSISDSSSHIYEPLPELHHANEIPTTRYNYEIPKEHTTPGKVFAQPAISSLDESVESTIPFANDAAVRSDHVQTIDQEHALENSIRTTVVLQLQYPQENQDIHPPWQRAFEEPITTHKTDRAHIQTEQVQPQYLPSISLPIEIQTLNETDSDRLIDDLLPPFVENVHVQNITDPSIISPNEVHKIRTLFSVQPKQIPNNETPLRHLSPIDIIPADHAELQETSNRSDLRSPLIPIQIELTSAPTMRGDITSEPQDVTTPRSTDENHGRECLPLVHQISISYASLLPAATNETEAAIIKYQEQHPFFSQLLPIDWQSSDPLPNNDRLIENILISRTIDDIQQKVECLTNPAHVTATAAHATYAFTTDGRFEDQDAQSMSDDENQHPNLLHAHAVIISHCSPTSDYETDSLDKDHETHSATISVDGDALIRASSSATNTLPTDIGLRETIDSPLIPLSIETGSKYSIQKNVPDSNEHDQPLRMVRASQIECEHDEDPTSLRLNHEQEQLTNVMFEDVHFHVPMVNEVCVYQTSDQLDSNRSDTSSIHPIVTYNENELFSIDHQHENRTVLSMANINKTEDQDEHAPSFYSTRENQTFVDRFRIEMSIPWSEQNQFAQINPRPVIIDDEDRPDLLDETLTNLSTNVLTIVPIQAHVRTEVNWLAI